MSLIRLPRSDHKGRLLSPDEAGGGAESGAQAPAEEAEEQREGATQGAEVDEASPVEAHHEAESQAAPRASLRLIRGGTETGDAFSFSGSATIGRFDPAVGPVDVDLGGLDEGSYVSRKHARISFQDGAWILEDLGSSNGTFVLDGGDFRRIEEPTPIEDGATIVFGNARFLFCVTGSAEEEGTTESVGTD